MATPQDLEYDKRVSARLMDVLIRAGLIAALVVLCYQVFAPFLTVMAWSLILAVSLFPMQRWLARKLGGRQGRAATLLVLAAVLLILTPTAFLLSSFGDSLRSTIEAIRQNTIEIPPPRESVQSWPVVGKKLYHYWAQAHHDLPGLVESLQPKLGEIVRRTLQIVGNIGFGFLGFLASLIIAGILMAYGEGGARACRGIFVRMAGPERGERFAKLSTATVRTVAQGVLGVALIQAIIIGLSLLIAGVPWAGLLSIIALILAIAQIPTLIVTLPAIFYIWQGSKHGVVAAVIYTIILVLAGIIDNVLKPFFLGRGVDAPMPVILLGALGGMASDGILGMFVGATMLALGYQLFMGWVAENPPPTVPPAADTTAAPVS